MNVALKIKVLESGKRQIQIAREIGISEPQLSKIVMGWVEPCEEVKGKIAKALGARPGEIWPGVGTAARECISNGGSIDG